MVRVPVSQGNRVTVQPEPRERLRYAAPRDMVGPAVQRFGQALTNAAEDFDQIEATYDEADALRIENEFRNYQRERLKTGENAYLATKGFDAGEGMTGAVDDLRTGADNLLQGARSERARAMAKRAVDLRLGESEERIATHSLAEMTTARVEQSGARIDNAISDASESFGTEQFAVHLGLAQMETQTMADLLGWGEEKTAREIEKITSKVHASVNARLMSEDDIDGAMAHLDAFSDEMLYEDEMEVRRALKPKVEFRQAEEDAGLVLGLLDDDSVPVPRDADGEPLPSPPLSAQLDAIESNESNGKQFDKNGKPLTSSAGAIGVMQVMPTTGPEAAKLAGLRWDENRYRNDADYNRAIGQAYYREMLRKFDGNAELAAAAYNAGPGRVAGLVRDHGEQWYDHLPAETRDYVAKFRKKTGIVGGSVTADMRNASGRVDASTAYQRLEEIAEREGWSPERTERARERIAVRISRDDALRTREEAARWDSVLDQVDTLGDNFTDVGQINGFHNLSPDRRMQLRNMADANRKGGVEENGDLAISLQVMAIESPEEFAGLDLREYKPLMTAGEFETLRLKQSKIAAAPEKEVSIRSGISSSIGLYSTKDMKLTGEPNRDRRLRVMDAMESYLRSTFPDVGSGKRTPTDEEYRKAFNWATEKVVVGKDFFGGDKERPRFERDYYDVPRDDRLRIVSAFRRVYGRIPNNREVIEWYEKEK